MIRAWYYNHNLFAGCKWIVAETKFFFTCIIRKYYLDFYRWKQASWNFIFEEKISEALCHCHVVVQTSVRLYYKSNFLIRWVTQFANWDLSALL